jgi:hypothetical protein
MMTTAQFKRLCRNKVKRFYPVNQSDLDIQYYLKVMKKKLK